MDNKEAIRDLSSELFEVIRRNGAQYGSGDDWRSALTRIANVTNGMSKDISEARQHTQHLPDQRL